MKSLQPGKGNSESIKVILENQLKAKSYSNAYLFVGSSGTGKTTLARIFASEINNHQGTPIEIDAASHGTVDTIRDVVSTAADRSLESEYKVIILDEAQMMTNQAWASILKTLEEPPRYTIFMFCTTDPEKIPQTIQNRCMRFNLSKIKTNDIYKRLEFINRDVEGNVNSDILMHISKMSNGCMRQAIANLEKVINSNLTSLDQVYLILNEVNYSDLFNLTNFIVDGKEDSIIDLIDKIDNLGIQWNLFLDQYTKFIYSLIKYIIFKNLSITIFTEDDLQRVKYTIGFDGSRDALNKIVEELSDLRYIIRNDSEQGLTIRISLLKLSRELFK